MQLPVHHTEIVRDILFMLYEEIIVRVIDRSLIRPVQILHKIGPRQQLAADGFELFRFFLGIASDGLQTHFFPSLRENFSCGTV